MLVIFQIIIVYLEGCEWLTMNDMEIYELFSNEE
jgi:hypothetical protein